MREDLVGLTFRDLFLFVWRGLPLALIVSILCIAGAYFLTTLQAPVYVAEAVLLAPKNNPTPDPSGASLATVSYLDALGYRTAAVGNDVVTRALQKRGVSDVTAGRLRSFRNNIVITTEETRDTSVISLVFYDASAEGAANGANDLAAALYEWDRERAERYVNRQIAALEAQITALTDRIRALQVADVSAEQIQGQISLRAQKEIQLSAAQALSGSNASPLEITQPALPPDAPSYPRPLLAGAAAFILGMVLSYGGLALRRGLSTRVYSAKQLAQLSGLPVLAEPRKSTASSEETLADFLRIHVRAATDKAKPVTVLVMSVGQDRSTPTVAANLAKSFAKDGCRTLLVNTDASSLGLHDSLEPHRHLASSTSDDKAKPSFLQTVGVGRCLWAVSVFLDDGRWIQEFSAPLEDWKREYDAVVISTAPILRLPDVLSVASFCSGTVCVVRVGRTDRSQLDAALNALRHLNIRCFGIVAANAKAKERYESPYAYGKTP